MLLKLGTSKHRLRWVSSTAQLLPLGQQPGVGFPVDLFWQPPCKRLLCWAPSQPVLSADCPPPPVCRYKSKTKELANYGPNHPNLTLLRQFAGISSFTHVCNCPVRRIQNIKTKRYEDALLNGINYIQILAPTRYISESQFTHIGATLCYL